MSPPHISPPGIAVARSILFVPGDRPDRFEKALASGADAVVLDLEDAVAPERKAAAREAVVARLAQPAPVPLGLRMNPLPTPEGIADLAALAGAAPSFLMLPKVEAAEEVSVVRRVLARGPRAVPLVALIESAAGLARAGAIAAEEGCVALGFGGVDLAADLGCEPSWEPLLAHRAALVAGAARAGRALFDVPFLELADEAGLEAECRRVRALGFTGKLAIHPRQLAGIHAAFTPSAAAVERAQRVIAAMEAAAGGVCVVDGRMVDAPVQRAALRVLARAGRG